MMMPDEMMPDEIVILCPHCHEIVREAYDGGNGLAVHDGCGGQFELPSFNDHPDMLGEGKPKKGRTKVKPPLGTRRVKEVVRNRHRHDREEVFDDGEQILNDNIEESVTTGAIAAPLASFPGTPRDIGSGRVVDSQNGAKKSRRAQAKGNKMTKKHTMAQPGKAIGGKTVKQDKTGEHDVKMTDHGEPFGRKQKNKGGQWEQAGAHVSEHMSPAQIADTIIDEGYTIQSLFDNYARGVNYVSLHEFNEIARAYGCRCHDEQQFMQLMEANNEFMFIEGNDGQGRYWVPQLMSESLPPEFKKNQFPKKGPGEKTDKERRPGRKSDEPDKTIDRNRDTPGASGSGEETEEWQPSENANNIDIPLCEEEANIFGALVEQVTGKPQGKRLHNGRRLPISENLGRRSTLQERGGFQEEDPESHFERFKDPGYDSATERDLSDFPLFNRDTEEMVDSPADLMGQSEEDFDEFEHSPFRSGDVHGGRERESRYGYDRCPECGGGMDELGCPQCGYTEGEYEDDSLQPADIASGREELERNSLLGPGGVPGIYQQGRDFYDAEADDFEESRQRRQPLVEHDHVAMDGPAGRGLEPHPGRSGGKDSGLPEYDTDMHDMGKEWPRRQKNSGGQWENHGQSKHGHADDDTHCDMGKEWPRRQKNSGGQWEELKGGRMSDNVKKMHESINLLSNHVRKMLAEYARNSNIANRTGRYQMRFLISAGDYVKPKMHNQLAEALADAEELVQLLGPESVNFEAQFCGPNGSVVLRRLVPLINVPKRGPIVQESSAGKQILFRFPELARDYADLVVNEGKACRAITHNWGAAVSTRIAQTDAARLFRTLAGQY